MSIFNPFSWFRSGSKSHLNTYFDGQRDQYLEGQYGPFIEGQYGPFLEEKSSAAGPIYSARNLGLPVWTSRDFASFAREVYKNNPIGYRCVKMISTNASSIRFLLHDKTGNEIKSHPLLDLLTRPSPTTGGSAFFEAYYSFLLLSGNGYIESVGVNNKPPVELWTLRSDRMRVIPGPFGIPSAFEYSLGGRKKLWQVDPATGDSEVLHVKEFNPLDDWYGLSRAEAASYGIDRHNSAAKHNMALLNNSATPSGALVLEPSKGSKGDVNAPQPIVDDAEKKLKDKHTGSKNAGKPMVLGGRVRWLEMGLSPRDMDFHEGKDDAARDICIAWGVPHILIVKGSATYNNIKEAKLELYEDTVLPIVNLTVDELNNWLIPKFDENLVLSADLDSISALEPRRETKRNSVTTLLDKGVIDSDEAREALQYGPRKKGAVKMIDSAVLTALVGSTEQIGLTPLMRYMQSVGLVTAKMTEQELLDAAILLAGEDEDDDGDGDDDDDDVAKNEFESEEDDV